MTLYDMIHYPQLKWSIPSYLVKTLLVSVAAIEITEASAKYNQEVLIDYPEAQIF